MILAIILDFLNGNHKMKLSIQKRKSSKKLFAKLYTNISQFSKPSSTQLKARCLEKKKPNIPKKNNNNCSSINFYSNLQTMLNNTCTATSKQKSTIISCLSTPQEFSKILKTQQNKSQRCKITNTKSLNKIHSEAAEEQKAFSFEGRPKVLKIEVFYGEVVFKNTFKESTCMKDIHTYFFTQIAKLEKCNHQRILGYIGLEGLQFSAFVDYWINQESQTIDIFLHNGIEELRLKPMFSNILTRQVTLADFDIYKCIGVGGFSKVYLGKCKTNGKLCALKFINKSYIIKNNKFKLLNNQREILSILNHKNLVQLYYSFETKNYIVFALEYCPNNELYQHLIEKGQLSQDESRLFFVQLLDGINYLHENKILYRDIKLENILIDAQGALKITDFGLSKPNCQQQEVTYSYCGSPEYMAPEMLMKCGHSFQVDYYALGILLYQLLIGKSPFAASTKEQIYYSTMNCQVKFPKLPRLSADVKSLIKGLLNKNPYHRIGSLNGIKQILSHPWIKKQSSICKSQFKDRLFREYKHIQNSDWANIQKQMQEDDFTKELKGIYYQNMKNYKQRVEVYMGYEKEIARIQQETGILRPKNINEVLKKITKMPKRNIERVF